MKKFLLLLTFILLGLVDQAQADGLQQNVYIYNSTSTIITDYQVKVDFNSSTFDFTNASSTGADIYFTDESEVVLNHWIKNFSSTGTSTIWVKVPSLAANSTTTIRMHYGDNTVTTTYSNASSTFLFYNNFDSGSIADWTGGEANIDIDGETATQSTSTNKYVSPFYSAQLSAHASCYDPPFNGAVSTLQKIIALDSGAYAVDFSIWREITVFPYSSTAVVRNAIKINNVDFGWDSSSCSGTGCTYNSGWLDQSVNFTTGTPITSLTLIGSADDCTTGNAFYDDVRIRKYVSTEPVASLEVAIVRYIAGSGGSITGNLTQRGFAGFNASSVTATPSTGYTFVDWSDDLLTATRTDTNITTNTSYTANFLINSYTLNYSANSGGTISGSSTQIINYSSDGSVVTATPNTGYTFVDWSDDLLTATRTDTNITENLSVSASFIVNTHTLAYFAGSHGTLTGSSTQIVDYGSDGSEIRAVANSGYRFLQWSDNLTVNPRTDLNISGNITVTATFEIIPSSGSSAPIAPPAIGTGIIDITIGMNQIGDIGTITNDGVNYLSYFNSNAGFDALISSNNTLQNHHLIINNLDLSTNIVQFTIQSNPQTFDLKIGEVAKIDLDEDNIEDIEIKFVNIWINRVELTIKSLLGVQEVKAESKLEIINVINKYLFKRDLKLGMTGTDVKELQKFLNNNGFIIDKTGAGSKGKETTRFGSLTQKALIKFQKDNKITPAVGYFGPVTRKVVNGK